MGFGKKGVKKKTRVRLKERKEALNLRYLVKMGEENKVEEDCLQMVKEGE